MPDRIIEADYKNGTTCNGERESGYDIRPDRKHSWYQISWEMEGYSFYGRDGMDGAEYPGVQGKQGKIHKWSKTEEPHIVLYYHDDYTGPVLEADTFDEFIYVMLLDSASWSGDIDNDHWKAHYQLLNDEYKKKIDGRTAEDLAEEYENRFLQNADIWKKK